MVTPFLFYRNKIACSYGIIVNQVRLISYFCRVSSNQVIVLSATYLGPVEYFAHVVQSGKIIIEKEEHYIKQTWRNRCLISASEGLLSLTVPVIKVNGNHTRIKDIRISYAENWSAIHQRAIESAYSHAPFFLFYSEAIFSVFQKRHTFLLDFDMELFQLMLELIGIQRQLEFTDQFRHKYGNDRVDLRYEYSPKKYSVTSFPRYIQAFEERHGFQSNLSIIDLIFCSGPGAADYLRNIKLPII
jgi:hypothetical protein